MSLLPSPFKRTELNGGVVAIVILAALAAIFIEVATLVSATIIVKLAVAMETLARFAAIVTAVSKLCGAAFLAGGVFPAALVAGFLRYDSNHALLALLLFALAVFFVFFAFLAREEFLAFGLRAAA